MDSETIYLTRRADEATGEGAAQESNGISLLAFLTALAAALIVFGVQTGLFLLLRNKLARILCVFLRVPRPLLPFQLN
jgi:hypothetical protein